MTSIYSQTGIIEENLGNSERQVGACDMNPETAKLAAQWMQSRNHTFQTHLLKPGGIALRFIPGRAVQNGSVLYGHIHCPDKLMDNREVGLNDRSLCPWYWKANYDPYRFPSMLPEALCRCSKAVLPNSFSYECEVITYQVKVLRFDRSCLFYKTDFEELAVACVPVLESVARNFANPQILQSLIQPFDY
ncbi:unnamed protein product [Soboliphyme baturini]|uniref:SCP domain-containing protein n=1 Tax=Soboliphyme baturini TaxID=241478 RepID=A0A183IXP3_9BILA|nr:unnamed protein product [Soboliphyme baturini]